MRTLIGFCLASLASTALFAQGHSGFVQPLPGIVTGGSVVHPGGTSSMPGVQRTTGSVVNPGGNTPQIGYPGVRQQGVRRNTGSASYAYPVYVGGYGYGYGYSGYDTQAVQPAPAQSGQPNVIVIYPQAPPQPQIYYQPAPPPQSSIVEVAPDRPEQTEATHYLVAFKDHSIYSAVAYWIDGDTIHYMVSGNLHKQAPVSSIDRELTTRLNEGSGLEIKLPAAK